MNPGFSNFKLCFYDSLPKTRVQTGRFKMVLRRYTQNENSTNSLALLAKASVKFEKVISMKGCKGSWQGMREFMVRNQRWRVSVRSLEK